MLSLVGTIALDVLDGFSKHQVEEKGVDHTLAAWKLSKFAEKPEPGHEHPSSRGSSYPKGGKGKPDTAAYNEEKDRITAEVDILQARLVSPYVRLRSTVHVPRLRQETNYR